MIKKISITLFTILCCVGFSIESEAAWVWSPDIGKWINPKKSAKDTPEEQLNWAMQFYSRREWDRAIEEFEKLPEAFPNSKVAAEGVYYLGLCWEEKEDSAKAADAYQKLIDRYPYSDRIKDAVKHEYDIANEFAQGGKVKMLGVAVLPGQEKALELYKHIVKNAPFGTYGAEAQYKIGEVYKSQGEFDEAKKAYQAVIDEYPSSTELVMQAKYQVAYMSLQASNKAGYNDEQAQRAIEEFEGFKQSFPTDEKAIEAEESIKALRAEKARQIIQTAHFYEKQKKFKSARVYYQEVAEKYGDTALAQDAKKKADELLQKENEPDKKSFFGIPKIKLW